jgi:hypothetical protein
VGPATSGEPRSIVCRMERCLIVSFLQGIATGKEPSGFQTYLRLFGPHRSQSLPCSLCNQPNQRMTHHPQIQNHHCLRNSRLMRLSTSCAIGSHATEPEPSGRIRGRTRKTNSHLNFGCSLMEERFDFLRHKHIQ